MIVVHVLDPEKRRSIGIQTESILKPRLSKGMKTHASKRIQTEKTNFGFPLRKKRRFSSEEKKNAIREVIVAPCRGVIFKATIMKTKCLN